MCRQARFLGVAAAVVLIVGLAAATALANPNQWNAWRGLRHELCHIGALITVVGLPQMSTLPIVWIGRTIMNLTCG